MTFPLPLPAPRPLRIGIFIAAPLPPPLKREPATPDARPRCNNLQGVRA